MSAGSSTTSSRPEHGAGDLLGEGDEALADLRAGGLHAHHAVVDAHPRRRVVVEALREQQVLPADRVPHAAPHVPGVGGATRAARAAHHRRARPSHGSGAARSSSSSSRTGATPEITWPVMLRSPVCSALRSRSSIGSRPSDGRQLVHLRLVAEARLHRAEAAHRPARRVVGAHREALDPRRGARCRGRGRSRPRWPAPRSRSRRRRRRPSPAAPRPSPTCRRVGRRGGTACGPDGGARGRRSSPRGSTSSSPACPCSGRGGRRGSAG